MHTWQPLALPDRDKVEIHPNDRGRGGGGGFNCYTYFYELYNNTKNCHLKKQYCYDWSELLVACLQHFKSSLVSSTSKQHSSVFIFTAINEIIVDCARLDRLSV